MLFYVIDITFNNITLMLSDNMADNNIPFTNDMQKESELPSTSHGSAVDELNLDSLVIDESKKVKNVLLDDAEDDFNIQAVREY